MDEKSLENVKDSLKLDRTDKLFDSAIERAGSNKTGDYDENDIKKQRLVIGFGNLHINTARVKTAAIRLLGYRNGLQATANAVKRKIRSAAKHGR